MKAVRWDEDNLGMTFEMSEIPERLVEQAEALRENLVETAAEADDELMERYLEDGERSKQMTFVAASASER